MSASPDEAEYQRSIRKSLPRNYGAHLVHGLLGQTGFRLLNAPTFIPDYLFLLSGSNLAVGLGRGLQALGMFLSPILSATLIEHRRRVLPVGFLVGGAMRVQILGIALAGFFLPPAWNLVAVCALLGLFGFFLGMQGVIFNTLLAKVIPVDVRGRLVGLRHTLAGLTAAGVAWLAGSRLVDSDALGNGYAATFLLAFALTALGLVALIAIREPEPPTRPPPARFVDRLRDLPGLLRQDRPYARYLGARALATLGRMAMPFYVIFARTRFELDGRDLGGLTTVFLLAWTSTNLAWGLLADRLGFRVTFLAGLGLWAVSVALLLQVESPSGLAVVFGLIGMGFGGFQMSAQNLVLEFGHRDELPMRIAVANSASELVGVVGPILGGVVATAFSYPALFGLAIGCKVLAAGIVLVGVPEPRHRD